MSKLIKQTIFVACKNSHGEADFFTCDVELPESECIEGNHYDVAKELAELHGYEGPFICFDHTEHSNIAAVCGELSCPVPTKCPDVFG
jgi:hypothetical protein